VRKKSATSWCTTLDGKIEVRTARKKNYRDDEKHRNVPGLWKKKKKEKNEERKKSRYHMRAYFFFFISSYWPNVAFWRPNIGHESQAWFFKFLSAFFFLSHHQCITRFYRNISISNNNQVSSIWRETQSIY